VIPFPVASDYGLLLALAGTCALLAGTPALKRYWFAFFFLGFRFRSGGALLDDRQPLAAPGQPDVDLDAQRGRHPALCEGNMITLPGDNQLFVAEACSGMRQLTGFLA